MHRNHYQIRKLKNVTEGLYNLYEMSVCHMLRTSQKACPNRNSIRSFFQKNPEG